VNSAYLFSIIGAISAMITIITITLGFIVKLTRKWTLVEERLAELVKNKDETHAAMLNQMRDDRNATDQRLTWLERNAWPHAGR
jgi:uncharacterized membrane protein (DUF106 family)